MSKRARESFLRVGLLAIAMLLSSCASMIDSTDEEKIASLQHASEAIPFRNGSPLKFITARSATIVGGREIRGAIFTKEGSVKVTFTKAEGGKKKKGVSGLAAALTRDGYYITAAHVIDGEAPHFIFPNGLRTFKPMRIVWIGDGLDIAVVKADVSIRKTFTPSPARPKSGDPLFVSGFGGKPSFGTVKHVLPINRSKVADVIRHNAPVRRGDSGGALIDADGKLVALTSAGLRNWNDAVAPDWDLVERVIVNDRLSQR